MASPLSASNLHKSSVAVCMTEAIYSVSRKPISIGIPWPSRKWALHRSLKGRSSFRAAFSLLLRFGCLKGGNHFRGSLNGSAGSAGVEVEGVGVAPSAQ